MSACLIPALSAEQALVLAPGQDTLPLVPHSPFHNLLGLSRSEMAASRGLEAAERRLLTKHFVDTFQWATVYPMLPLRLVVPSDVPLWRPRLCRSYYRWLPPPKILTAEDLKGLDDFDLLLLLFDFSPWRPILAQRFCSHMGPPPLTPRHRSMASITLATSPRPLASSTTASLPSGLCLGLLRPPIATTIC
jgi:hypothetical protein